MRDASLAVTTTEELANSSFQLVDYIDELTHISIFGSLRDVNYFHMDIHDRSHHELNGVLEKMVI